MKKFFIFILMLAFGIAVEAQPAYYNHAATTGGTTNIFPFNVNPATGKRVQYVIAAGEFILPAPAPAGNNITSVWFFALAAANATYTTLTVRMATVSTSTFISTGAFYTGPMTTVRSQNTTIVSPGANSWVEIPLTTPFAYDPTMNLIIEVSQCGFTGTGFSLRQLGFGAAPNYRRQYSDAASPCGSVALPTGGDLNLPGIGISVTPATVPCNNTFPFGSATIDPGGAVVTISTCSFAGDYSTINGAVNGQTLRFTSSVATDFITVRSGTPGGPVLASGTTPLVFPNTFTGTVYAHWNTPGCGTQSTCRTTTVQCTSCGVAPCTITRTSAAGTDNQTVCANGPITNITYATTVATGATFSGLPAGVTGSWAANVATISGIPTANGVFNYTVTLVGCSSTTTATGTITVIANQPMTIVAVPGTTLCQGDPSLLTVYNSSGTVPVTVTHSSSNTITAGTGVSCGTAGVNTAINSYWRAYDLSTFPAVTGNFTINSVNFGIEQLTGGTQLFTVRLYNQTGGAFPGGTRTQIASQTFNIPVQSGTIFTATFGTPVTVSNTSTVVVEVEKSAVVTGQFFFPGGNAAAETGPSYLSAPACAIVNPVTYASIGFPNTHLVIALAGTVTSLGSVVTGGTFLWSPAAGLSSTTTNPVAASPAATTTYTVNHNNGSGCIRQANITLTVNLRPTVTTQPANATVCATSTATFTVGGTGTGLTYQWQESVAAGPFNNITNGGPYSGATTATLVINPVTAVMNGNRYRCVLSGTCPAAGTANISNPALLTVNGLPVVAITPAGPVCGGIAGINGTSLSTASQAPPIPGSVTVNSGTINLAVPDNTANGVSNNLTVAGIPANATITNVSVTLNNFSHTYPGDMIIHLKAPNNAILNLYKYGGGLFTGAVSGVPTWGWYGSTVSQLGTVAWSTVAVAPFIYNNSTSWKADAINGAVAGPTIQNPTGFVSAAANFQALYTTGPSANGTWTLAMCDGGAGDVGTLGSWSIKIDYTTPGGTGTPLTYTWSPAAGLYMDPLATVPYIAGTQTPQVYAAPTVLTVYTVTGTDGTTGCSNTATVVVNYTPPAPTITPSAVTMCLGDPAVKLKSSSSQSFSSTFNSGALSLAIPDGPATWPQTLFPGVATPNLAVSGIPANATITGMSVKLNLTHTYIADMVIVLKAPNGAVFNLDANINKTGGAGANFVNTIISSTSSTPLSNGLPPYTGTFQADAVGATYVALGFTFPGGPTSPAGYIPTVTTFSGLYSVPNGNWTLGIYDWGAGDLGILTNWELKIDYMIGVAATPAVWSPAAGLFSDASASTAYVAGTPVDSVWAKPTPSGVYPYTATVQGLASSPPVTIATPMAGGNQNSMIFFNLANTNAVTYTLNSLATNSGQTGAVQARVWYKALPIAGNPGAITAANGWIASPTFNINVTAGVLNTISSTLNIPIPAGQTYGIGVEFLGGLLFPAYTNGTGVLQTYTNNGCSIITDGNVGWGGPVAPGPPANNPRNFNGTVSLSAPSAGACTSPARTVVVTVNQPATVSTQPVNQTVCTDKVATFTAVAAGTGPFTYQWQVSTDNGNVFTNISNGGVYSGTTTATLVITAPPVSMNDYQYRVIIQGAAPCASATSFKVILKVNPLPTIVISANPYTRLFPGLVTTLSSTVTPNAAGVGGYVWLRNGVQVAGANTGTLNVSVDGLGDYSLRVTDVNGCTNTSNVVSIRDSVSGKCFIYPNPNNGQFQVRFYSALNNVLPRSVIVYDAKGEQVLVKSYIVGRPYDRMDVDLRRNGKGLYWVEVVDMNGNRLTMCRLVIQ